LEENHPPHQRQEGFAASQSNEPMEVKRRWLIVLAILVWTLAAGGGG
jgi:hypothetical protein